MNRIIFPIEGGRQGPEVTELQDALQLFMDRGIILRDDEGTRKELSALLKRERAKEAYRDATLKLVGIFQETRGISPQNFGEVDETTANEMNALLKELGQLERETQECQSAVGGRVQRDDGLPFPGGRVRLFHEARQGALRLGEDSTDADGNYTIRYELLPGASRLNLYVTVSDASGKQLARSGTISGANPIEVIDLVVPSFTATVYRVTGRVGSRSAAGVAGLRVQIVDKTVGDDLFLAEAVTNTDGAYQAEFDDSGLRQRGKTRPDLQALVYVNERLVGSSDVRYDASPRETLDIRLDEKAGVTVQSEHETLTADLARQFGGRLGDLQETDDRQDITYLANKTGWDARAVALAALADQFSARTQAAGGGLEPVWFYALFRAGVPANEQALYQTDAAAAQTTWKKAIAQGVIPAGLENEIPTAAERFQQLAARHALDRPALAGLSSLKEMLTVSLGEDDVRQTRFAELYTRNRTDLPAFWEAVRGEFGEATEKRLRRDGKLAFLTLNNALLIHKLHGGGQAEINDPLELVERGYYRPEAWKEAIGADPVPPEITGANQEEKSQRYAELLAAQMRLSYPTAVVAQMVRTGETPLAAAELVEPVHAFLAEHQGNFEIGMQPVERYLAHNELELAPEVIQAVTRIQRVYQITPDDGAMNSLLKNGVDSAFTVAGYDRAEFVQVFKDQVGGEAQAALIHAKAQQVYNVTLNLAVSYLSAKNAPAVGVRNSPPAYISPEPNPNGGDVIAYPTLEGLFGEFDFCDCEHCRSILSPAAYLVDLLQFSHRPTNEKRDPQEVLFERRPDIEHLPLTCENTNIPLPYIDLVNETLEYYITNNLSLAQYRGHDTSPDATPAELLANPQFVSDQAYATLAGKPLQPGDPEPLLPPTPPLPFHQPLESLRRYFDHFEAPLPEVMEALRTGDNLERASVAEYGWRDIMMEELRLSRAEHALLTERALTGGNTDLPLTIRRLCGYGPAISDARILAELANAKQFTRRVGLSYEELVEILRTRFINPHAALIPKLEKLGVSFARLKELHDSAVTGQDWLDLLPQPSPDAVQYGGDIEAWVKDEANFGHIMGLITLADPTGAGDECSFDALEFRYSNPDMNANQLRGIEFVTLLRFIRLWKKLGWTIDQTDKALVALYPPAQAPNDPDDAVNLELLDAGFLIALPRLGVLRRALQALNLKPKKDLLALLACFAPLDTHGVVSLYRQMFLSPALLKQDPAFADDGFGSYLTDNTQKLLAHSEALRAAFQMTEAELNEAAAALGFDANTTLDLANISAVFRRGWLARKLKLSQREFRLLVEFTGIDPFAMPEPPDPAILRLVRLVSRLRAAPLKPAQALYLIWNQDLSGKSAPEEAEITGFARTLRGDFSAMEAAFALVDDPDGQIARARMALVYGNDATDAFFGLLDRKLVTDVTYTHAQPGLEGPILAAAPGLAYDHLRKRLSYGAGVLPDGERDALLLVPGTTQAFRDAAAELHRKSRLFFERYPELLAFHDDYLASADPLEKRRSDLLARFLPELKRRRKRQQALQAISGLADAELSFAAALLEEQTGGLFVLHATGDGARPALDDLLALEAPGLTARFYFRDTATDPVDQESAAEAVLAYSRSSNSLPANGGNPISGIWSGYLEAPENGFFNFLIEAEAGSTATLTLGRAPVALAQNGAVWSNTAPLELHAGVLYGFTLQVEKVVDTLNVRWETAGRGREIIPARYLYAQAAADRLRLAYTRFFRAASLARALKLTSVEIAYLATHADTLIGGQSWLNSLPVDADPDGLTSAALLAALAALLGFARYKARLAPGDERLLEALQDPVAATQAPESSLFTLTRWEPASLTAMLARFGLTAADLAQLDNFVRVAEALAWAQKLGVSAAALIQATTNEPDAAHVRSLQAVLRARYDEGDWLNVLQPINDALRAAQRDALVAYILHQMRLDPAQAHIDTPDKLFEYFLMDVQMEPCMQTSRIRHALSSVQLFIERCQMNLEPEVAPSSIIAHQWQWMSRYRVWEADRKVFLWPENWLEPELRDDQSPFFKETMGELLQSDITEERAAMALLNYLARLDEVAKLEVCGIHYVENDPGTADDVVHVVARTAGASRKYFYRRRDPSGWMPWEQIKLDIEDNPVIPLVWNNRLFVFWLKIMQQAPLNVDEMSTSSTSTASLGELSLSDVKTDAKSSAKTNTKISYQAALCWSEFYNGKWQPARTSDVNRPLDLGQYDPVGINAFDRSKWKLAALFFTKGALRLIVTDGSRGASFFLHNTFSAPELRTGKKEAHFPFKRSSETSTSALKINYPNANVSHDVLTNSISDRTIEPNHSIVANPWDAPFFYEDGRHVFYVTTSQRLVKVPQWNDFGVVFVPPKAVTEIPPLVLKPSTKIPDIVGPVIQQPGFGVVDPSPMERLITEDAYIQRGLGTNGTVAFGTKEIGPAGSMVKNVRVR